MFYKEEFMYQRTTLSVYLSKVFCLTHVRTSEGAGDKSDGVHLP